MPNASPAPRWDSALLTKYDTYDTAAPRYTSYPTAAQFSDRFTADDYRRLWPRETASITPLSLHVHIPFCENICCYCASNKVLTPEREEVRRYLDHLQREIKLQSEIAGKRPITQLHWGGGSSTCLSAAEMTELMHSLATHFKLIGLPSRDYSIEIDPRTVGKESLALLKGLGFNRLSFGIQDFDERVQRAINREQSFSEVELLCRAARSYDFDSVSFDLSYGLPLQTVPSLRRTLRQVIDLAPHRIALHNYAHLPQRFSSQRAFNRLSLPATEEKLAMLAVAIDMLCAAGYLYIGMDHFVLPDDALAQAQQHADLQRSFQGYSTSPASDLLGLGVSAISGTRHGYAQNASTLGAYYKALEKNELPIVRGLELTPDDIIRRYVIMQIICNLRLDIGAVEEKFGINFKNYFGRECERLCELKKDGLISLNPQQLQVTSSGRLLLRNICIVFDRYLQQPVAASRYSGSM